MSVLEWIESLPVGWSTHPLKRVAVFRNSNVDKKSYENGNPVRLCNYTDVYYNEFISPKLGLMEATATLSEIARFSLSAGDVIITKDSESWDDIAVPACVTQGLEGVVCGYHLTLIRPHVTKLYGPFLLRCLQATGIREQLWISATGVTRFGLGQDAIGGAVIPIPPLPVQQKIADFLDRKTAAIDALIRKKERLIELLQEKRQAFITHVVTKGLDPNVPMKDSGIEWLGEIPAHWEVVRIKHVCDLESGHTPSRSEPAYWIDDECVIPWVSLNDTKTMKVSDVIVDTFYKISPRGMANSSAHLISEGAVVFTRDATIGLSAIMGAPMAVSQHIIAWVCGARIYNRYLLRVIDAMASHLDRMTFGATIKTIGMDDVKQLTTPLPPLDEQTRMVEHLSAQLNRLDLAVARLQTQLDRLKEYRQALISAAVTGQLPIPEPEPTP